jgi:nucleotide-binding universal stress UspA family protein
MKLLLAVDDSAVSGFALREVLQRPWPPDVSVRVLSVMSQDPASAPAGVPVPSAPLGEVLPPWPEGTLRTRAILDTATREIALTAARTLIAGRLRAEVVVREGDPGEEIVAEARTWGADLIVMGSHGRGALKRLLLGSVATQVLHHAPCSVQIVRAPEVQ